MPDEYLSTGHEFANQDPDELMTNEESHKKTSNSVKVHLKDILLVCHMQRSIELDQLCNYYLIKCLGNNFNIILISEFV